MTAISVFAKKGGVGKSTLAFNLAGFLASQNYRVLMIDCDSQASLSQAILGPEAVERLLLPQTVAALFDGVIDPDPAEMIHETGSANIWLVPANDLLHPFNDPNPRAAGPLQFVLRDFVAELSGHADFILFDTPPNFGVLPAWACLMASDYTLSPVNMETFSAQSVTGVIRKLEEAHAHGNPQLETLGYVVNLRDKRRALHAAHEKMIRKLYGPQVFDTVIFNWSPIAESQAQKKHIFDYAPDSDAAAVNAALGAELLNRLQLSLKRAA